MIIYENNIISALYDRCQQCGACLAVCPTGALSFTCRKNGLADISVDQDKCIRCLKCFRACPANKAQEFEGYFDGIENRKFYLGRNRNQKIAEESSSGCVCKTIIIESLRKDLVDGVYSLRKLGKYPSAEGEFYSKENIPDYDTLPNSVYHSIMQCLELSKVPKCRRLMIVGTSCQLKALEVALKGKYEQLIKVCIFCKQQKSLDSTRFLAKITGAKFPDLKNLSVTYRGGGWPGTVTVMGKSLLWGRAAQIPFGRRLWTVPGCNYCGDPLGFITEADITLMDPWSIDQPNEIGRTLAIVNNSAGEELLTSISELDIHQEDFNDVSPALDLNDIRRKQAVVSANRGDKVSGKIVFAAKAEKFQRAYLRAIVTVLPKMPMIFYRILCKLPDLRNLILRKI